MTAILVEEDTRVQVFYFFCCFLFFLFFLFLLIFLLFFSSSFLSLTSLKSSDPLQYSQHRVQVTWRPDPDTSVCPEEDVTPDVMTDEMDETGGRVREWVRNAGGEVGGLDAELLRAARSRSPFFFCITLELSKIKFYEP